MGLGRISHTLFVASLAALVIGSVPVALGDTLYFSPSLSSGNWDDEDNWKSTSCAGSPANDIPDAADDVVICTGKTATVGTANGAARTVASEGTGKVEVTPGSGSGQNATLSLGSGSSDLTSSAPITLKDGGGPSIAILAIVSANHTLSSGVGGEDSDAQISIAANKTLTNGGLIAGRLMVTSGSSATFVNDGVVYGNHPSGLITIAAYVVDDTADADWQVINGGAIKFDSSINTVNALDGDFFLLPGFGGSEIEINKSITTTGFLSQSIGTLTLNENLTMGGSGSPLDFKGGTIDVAAGKFFTHE